MNRLQKKCFIAATGLHLFLVLLLVVGPALTPKQKTVDLPVIDFIPLITTDDNVSGGGSRTAPAVRTQVEQRPVAPTQPPPQPTPVVRQPDPPKVEERSEPKETVIPDRPAPKKAHQVKVNTKLVTKGGKKTKSPSPNTSREQLLARAELDRQLSSITRNIRENLSSSTEISMPGPGTSGVPYANFLQGVKAVYTAAWSVPDGVTDDEATATASVTINRDGSVASARLIESSGNPLVDQSVQSVLRRVKFAVPLPAGAKEDQRTVTIGFNIKAK